MQAGSWVDCRLCREACGSDGDAGLLRPPCAHPSSAGTPPSWRPPSEPRRPAVLVDPALASGCRAPGRSLSSRWHCPRPALGPARAAAPGACGGRQQLQAVGALGSTTSPHPRRSSPLHENVADAAAEVTQGVGLGQAPQEERLGLRLGPGPWPLVGLCVLELVIHVQPDPAGTAVSRRPYLPPCSRLPPGSRPLAHPVALL